MKRWSLRVKILVSVGLIVLAVLGSSTFIHLQNLQADSLEAMNLRSEALAQGIVSDILKRFPLLVDTTEQRLHMMLSASFITCNQIYELNKDKGIAFIAIIAPTGIIANHSDREQWDRSLEDSPLFPYLQQREQITVLDGEYYHTFIPIFSQDNVFLGTVDIGSPKSLIEIKVAKVIHQSVFLFVGFLLLAFFTVSLFVHVVLTKPIRQLVASGEQLARGNLVQIPLQEQSAEIASLNRSFNRISAYLQHIAEVSSNIATGVIASEIQVRSEHDILGQAIHDMLQYLKHVATVAAKVTEGNLTETVHIRSAQDAFGRVIQSMTEGLRSLVEQLQESAHRIAATGSTISSLTKHDMEIVEHVQRSADQMSSTAHEMGASIEEVAHNVEMLSSSVEETSVSVTQMTTSVGHIASKSKNLRNQTHQTIEFLNHTVASLDDIVKSTDESQELSQATIQDALDGQEAVEQVITSVETIQQTMTTAVESINRFAQRSSDIDTILDVIREITEQTSLLALNASIIAAQAGVHGRGFAVVADEIKNLASGVGSSTKDIAAIVQTLQQETTHVVQTIHEGASNVKQGIERTQQAREALQKILTSAERSSSLVTQIATTLHGLMTSGQQVSQAMRQVDTMTDDITMATNEQEASTKQINDAIVLINDMTSQIQQATAEQLHGVHTLLTTTGDVTELIDQNLHSSQRISETTVELASQADILLHSIERFTLTKDE
jgi:methyl-accepting chemotaxis protein